jgi:hypothetical protein
MRAEKELSQPQLYGTSYLLVRIALIGQTCSEKVNATLSPLVSYRVVRWRAHECFGQGIVANTLAFLR